MSQTTNVTPIRDAARDLRRARGQYVKDLIEADGRSARYVAARIGLSSSAFNDRLNGKAPFLADELELIASVIKMPAQDFYSGYVGRTGLEPVTDGL